MTGAGAAFAGGEIFAAVSMLFPIRAKGRQGWSFAVIPAKAGIQNRGAASSIGFSRGTIMGVVPTGRSIADPQRGARMETLSRFTYETVAALAVGDAYMRPARRSAEGRGFCAFVGPPLLGAAPLFVNSPHSRGIRHRRRRGVPERPLRSGCAIGGMEMRQRTTTGASLRGRTA